LEGLLVYLKEDLSQMTPMLPDLLAPNLRVVFCGTAAGLRSAEIECYYAGQGNQFWKVMAETGITPRLFAPEEFRLLLELRVGLTDLVKDAAGMDGQLHHDHYDIKGFTQRMELASPKIVAFNGKTAAAAFYGCDTDQVDCGLQDSSLAASQLFVLPSTSAAARRYWDIRHWFDLARLIHAL
jgi:double-stranded uracil-DNA glycosylase